MSGWVGGWVGRTLGPFLRRAFWFSFSLFASVSVTTLSTWPLSWSRTRSFTCFSESLEVRRWVGGWVGGWVDKMPQV